LGLTNAHRCKVLTPDIVEQAVGHAVMHVWLHIAHWEGSGVSWADYHCIPAPADTPLNAMRCGLNSVNCCTLRACLVGLYGVHHSSVYLVRERARGECVNCTHLMFRTSCTTSCLGHEGPPSKDTQPSSDVMKKASQGNKPDGKNLLHAILSCFRGHRDAFRPYGMLTLAAVQHDVQGRYWLPQLVHTPRLRVYQCRQGRKTYPHRLQRSMRLFG